MLRPTRDYNVILPVSAPYFFDFRILNRSPHCIQITRFTKPHRFSLFSGKCSHHYITHFISIHASILITAFSLITELSCHIRRYTKPSELLVYFISCRKLLSHYFAYIIVIVAVVVLSVSTYCSYLYFVLLCVSINIAIAVVVFS